MKIEMLYVSASYVSGPLVVLHRSILLSVIFPIIEISVRSTFIQPWHLVITYSIQHSCSKLSIIISNYLL